MRVKLDVEKAYPLIPTPPPHISVIGGIQEMEAARLWCEATIGDVWLVLGKGSLGRGHNCLLEARNPQEFPITTNGEPFDPQRYTVGTTPFSYSPTLGICVGKWEALDYIQSWIASRAESHLGCRNGFRARGEDGIRLEA